MADTKNVTFKIRRFNPEKDKTPSWKSYEVPVHHGMTVLDGLHHVKQHLDNTLAWRYSCRMGVCGSCAMLINGRPGLACNTQILDVATNLLALAPLPNFNTIKDLVPDLMPMFEKHQGILPHTLGKDAVEMDKPTGEFEQSPEELEAYLQFSYCIRCGACMAACPTMATDQAYLGPMPLTQAFRYMTDTRDAGKGTRQKQVDTPHGAYRCHFGSECSNVCPKGVDPAKAIQLLKRRFVFDYLKFSKGKTSCNLITEPRTTGRREGIPEAPAYTIEQK